MASESRNGAVQAFPDLERSSEPPRDSCLSVDARDSRPPSYNTVSAGNQVADESARKARAIRDAETEVKSIISTGDRESVDNTHEKVLVPVSERKEAPEPVDAEEDDDEFVDARSGDSISNSEFLQKVTELQMKQEHLLKMHAEHNRQLEDLIRQKPAVNEQFKKIRKSFKNGSNGSRSNGSDNASNSNGAHAEVDSSNSTSRENTNQTSPTNNNSDHSDADIYENTKSKSTDDASASNDQVTTRKPSRSATRHENATDAFRKLGFPEGNAKVCVQLEQLYANVHRLHLPSEAIRKLMFGPFLDRTENSNTYFIAARAAGDNELSEMKRANEGLKSQNAELQEELEKVRKEKEAILATRRNPPPLPPKPEIYQSAPNTGARGRARQKPERNNGPKQENLRATREVSPKFVAGRPTSPTVQRVRPLDVEIREVTVQHRIENYSQKLYQEKLHKECKQVSSPFYTAQGGCRAQLEIFLNGNGTGRNRCMSLFIRVIPGEYDNFITWPINLHIRATLMNQQRGLSHSVEDNGNQFQFSRPQGFSDSNDCWGLVEFVNHHMIYKPGFIKDDTIILRCKVCLLS